MQAEQDPARHSARLYQHMIGMPQRINGECLPHATEPKPKGQVVVVGIHDFITRQLPPREQILSPWLLSQSLNMIYAWRGVGKTHVALGIAYAIASGGKFLGWGASKPRGVLYIDGEMSGSSLQERLAAIVAANDREAERDLLGIITPDLQPDFAPLPDLATHHGQAQIEATITEKTEVIIVDNLSCLVRLGGRENEAESWSMVQGWALRMRARGKSVLFIHHAGKNGLQRGTSKREDVLDTVICLKQPADYEPSQGACFEVHFEKSRSQYGDEVSAFEAKLSTENGKQTWLTRSVQESTYARVVELANAGLRQTEIAAELEVNRSTVSRHWRAAQANGAISVEANNGRK